MSEREVLPRISLLHVEQQGRYNCGMSIDTNVDTVHYMEMEREGLKLVVD